MPTPRQNAQQLHQQGFQVVPAPPRQKLPMIAWKKFQAQPITDVDIVRLFPTTGQQNYFIIAGRQSRLIVVDCDNDAAEAWFRERIDLDTAVVKTRQGRHFWFRIPDDWLDRVPGSWSVHHEKFQADIRGEGGGVIAPPSMHESGHVYTWERGLEHLSVAPPELLDGTLRAEAPRKQSVSSVGETKAKDGTVRSMLSTLLADPPAEGGRNDWLARVAGHHARTYRSMRDVYVTMCKQANETLPQPLDEAEFTKTIDSIWDGEHERNSHRALDADNGFLQGTGIALMTQVRRKASDGETWVEDIDQYANFDLKCNGIIVDDNEDRTYWVDVGRMIARHKPVERMLSGKVLGDSRKFETWLAGLGVSIFAPPGIYPQDMKPTTRIQRYLESQGAPVVREAKTLGWDMDILGGDGGFVTHQGVITADEVLTHQQAGIRPDPNIQAPHLYGFDHDADEARRVLSEVMTFHEDEVTSVYGSWWAMCLLKPQVELHTSLFPFMAIEAPSESGKTNGFFAMMLQLIGDTRGEIQPTKASLRDMAAAHRSGVVWVDDLDDAGYLHEILRAATSGGTLTKMGEDNTSITGRTIVSPIVISGEALGLGQQKALRDRAIIIKAGSPTKRRSRHDGSRPQWDDILALRTAYPGGLAGVAGWLVQEALRCQGRVIQALSECRRGKGRAGDKAAILLAGARLMDHMLGESEAWTGKGETSQRVEAWLGMQDQGDSAENALTLEVIPWALSAWNLPRNPKAGEPGRDVITPAFVKGDLDTFDGVEIWFNTKFLAEAWRKRNGKVELRTHTEEAFNDQAKALGLTGTKQTRVDGATYKPRYRVISGVLAQDVLERVL